MEVTKLIEILKTLSAGTIIEAIMNGGYIDIHSGEDGSYMGCIALQKDGESELVD